jgi:colicin import membrane protein
MQKDEDSSVLFNLRELMSLEEDRVQQEHDRKRQAEEAARRAREAEEQRKRDEEAARLRAEQEARLAQERREREEVERAQREKDEREMRLRFEAEQQARLRETETMLQHQRELEALRIKETKPAIKPVWVVGVVALLAAVTGGLYFGVYVPRQAALEEQARRAHALAEQQAEEKRKLEAIAEQERARAAEAEKKAKLAAEEAARKKPATASGDSSTGSRGPSRTRRDRADRNAGGSTTSKPAQSCPDDDPLCGLN